MSDEFIQVLEQAWRAKRGTDRFKEKLAEAQGIADEIYGGNVAVFEYKALAGHFVGSIYDDDPGEKKMERAVEICRKEAFPDE